MKLFNQRNEIISVSEKLLSAGLLFDGQGNISIFDRQSGLVAITPSAVPYDQRTAEDIPVIDLEGNLIDGNWQPTSEISLHLVYYRTRADVNAVIHTHAPRATVFGVIGTDPMPMILTEAAMGLGGAVPIAPYRRPGTEDLAITTCQATGMGSAAIMAHHGLITVGENIDLAYLATIAAENTAEILIMARSMGCKALTLDSAEVSALREMTLKHKPLPA